MKTLNLYDNTLIVLTSDHGESLGEHGEVTHGIFVYNATMWVPLIMKLPGGGFPGRIIDDLVRHIDILPTILGVLNLKNNNNLNKNIQGISLIQLINGEKKKLTFIAYLESYYPKYQFNWSPLESIRTNTYKYVKLPIPELYDMFNDPSEKTNIYEKEKGKDPKNLIFLQREIIHASDFINDKKFKKAIEILQNIFLKNNDNIMAKSYLASSYYAIGDINEAIKEYEEVKKLDSTYINAYLNLISIYLHKQKDLEKAEKEIEAAFSIAPKSLELFSLKEDLALKKGELKKSNGKLSKGVKNEFSIN